MKILFLGDIGLGQTSLMRMKAFDRLGHQVVGVNTVAPWRSLSWTARQLQRRLHRGSAISVINRNVLAAAKDFRPDIVWGEKQEYLRVETLQRLRSDGARLVHFTPDPYFSLPWKRTRLMDEAIGMFDVLVYCKAYEKADYESLGAQTVYMPLGYCDQVHQPTRTGQVDWSCSVGFLGGWEPRREQLLRALALSGIELKVWGGYWEFLKDGRWTIRRYIILKQLAGKEGFAIRRDPVLSGTLQGGEVYGDDYASALSGARIGVGFLRKVCADQHTTRTFEIPACGSMLLADRTDEHCEFFTEGKEAEYFVGADELVDKAAYYAKNDSARQKIAESGRQRCIKSGYSYLCRLKNALGQMGIN